MNVILKLGAGEMSFVIRVWLVFLGCMAMGIAVSLLTKRPEKEQLVTLTDIDFDTTKGFKIASIIIVIILIAIYAIFW